MGKLQFFSVKHYAGSVKYTVDGWVEKNMDTIPKVFETALGSSEHKASPVFLVACGVANNGI